MSDMSWPAGGGDPAGPDPRDPWDRDAGHEQGRAPGDGVVSWADAMATQAGPPSPVGLADPGPGPDAGPGPYPGRPESQLPQPGVPAPRGGARRRRAAEAEAAPVQEPLATGRRRRAQPGPLPDVFPDVFPDV
ncbi:hypothetical protein J7E97_21380, partial [Streptomyces sp. ISL-66]|nr:hypothetical protein [Streptomyces sp. ISL-66]